MTESNLQANSGLARRIVETAIPTFPHAPDWPEHRALDTAILTPRDHWSESKTRELAPLLSRFG